MSPLKKISLIIAFLAVSGLIGYGLYYIFTRPVVPAQKPPAVTLPTGQLPSAGERPATTSVTGEPTGGELLPIAGIIQPTTPSFYKPVAVNRIVSNMVTSPSLNGKGDFRYYNASNGKFYKIMPDGSVKVLSDQVFFSAQKVTWAANQDKAVIEYPDSSKIIYDFANKKQVTLPKHWQDFSFSADGAQVAAKSIGLSPENRWLVTVNDDGTGSRLIEPLGENADKVIVNWSPSRQVVAFSQTGEPMGAERREVLFVGLNGENFKSTIVEGMGFEPKWSTTGKKLLYNVYSSRSDYKPELWLVDSYGDSIGNNRQTLKLNTWADKCSFSDDSTLFCAVPRDLPQGAAMAREIASNNYDDLYKIDLRTGLKTAVPLNDNYNITNLSYDPTTNKVIFTSLNQQGVFESQL